MIGLGTEHFLIFTLCALQINNIIHKSLDHVFTLRRIHKPIRGEYRPAILALI